MNLEKLYEIFQKYCQQRGFELNKDKEYVFELLRGLIKNEERYGYRSCPCRLASGSREKDSDIICPCIYSTEDIKEYGRCYCGLFVSKDFNEGKIKFEIIPERRKKLTQEGG
ncbi:MAG: ferredoxin:thioredoxin reductase [Thermodesulfovibrio sp.]|nr:ferredoxin:thioredoxin reductase [Thermodesulfovibrio sp.]